MKRFLLLASVAAVAVGGTAIAVPAHAGAAKVKCKGKQKAGNKVVVKCPRNKLRGPRGPQGPPGEPGASGGGGAAGLNLNFNARLVGNERKAVTIGNFTVEANADAVGACVAANLQIGDTDAQIAFGLPGAFVFVPNNTGPYFIAGPGASNAFTGVSVNGNSTVSGIVGLAQQGATCLVSGYVTGA